MVGAKTTHLPFAVKSPQVIRQTWDFSDAWMITLNMSLNKLAVQHFGLRSKKKKKEKKNTGGWDGGIGTGLANPGLPIQWVILNKTRFEIREGSNLIWSKTTHTTHLRSVWTSSWFGSCGSGHRTRPRAPPRSRLQANRTLMCGQRYSTWRSNCRILFWIDGNENAACALRGGACGSVELQMFEI